MKISSLLLTVLVLVAGTLTAQDQPKPTQSDTAAGTLQERVAKLVGELGLKPEQKEKFAAIVQDQTSSREEKIAKLKELLTPEQFENLTKVRTAGQGAQGGGLQERLVKMVEQLGLKPEQKAKFIAIAQQHDEKTRAIQQDQKTSLEEKEAQASALGEASKAKMQEILTAEQFEKLIQLHSQTEKK